MSFNIIIDSREKYPHKFNYPTTVRKLATGDYSIEGELETKLCIERKASISEFYGNITKPAFWREMERIKEYPYRYLILEFPQSDVENFPHSLNLPKKIWSRMKITPKYIFSCINKIQMNYEVITLFVDNRTKSQQIILDIMKRVHETSQR